MIQVRELIDVAAEHIQHGLALASRAEKVAQVVVRVVQERPIGGPVAVQQARVYDQRVNGPGQRAVDVQQLQAGRLADEPTVVGRADVRVAFDTVDFPLTIADWRKTNGLFVFPSSCCTYAIRTILDSANDQAISRIPGIVIHSFNNILRIISI